MDNKWKYSLMAFAVVALAACGGGGDDDDSTPSPGPSPSPGDNIVNTTKVDGRRFTKGTQSTNLKTVAQQASVQANTIRLGELPADQAFVDYGPGKATRVGAARNVALTATAEATRNAMAWSQNAAGQAVGALAIQAEGARGLRLGLLVDALPDTAVVQVSSTNSGDTVYEATGAEINAALAANAGAGETGTAARTWWSPNLGGDRAELRITLPAGATAASLAVAIPVVSHVFADLDTLAAQGQAKDVGDSESCELDVTCYTNGANERDAVARMQFVKDGNGYLCTGTLLNDAAQSNRPYFITANHCISAQSVATTLQTDWFFRSASCNSTQVNRNTTKLGRGATLLWSQSANDMTLLRLNEAPPSGVWLAGWDAGQNNQAQDVYDIHQPMGDLAKISAGRVTSYATCSGLQCENTNNGNAPFYRVYWNDGTTEGGSSGSGLLTASGHLIGTLYAGTASCSNRGGHDNFGRLDIGFANGINRWLAAKDPTQVP